MVNPHIIYRPANAGDSGLCYAIRTRSIKPYVTAVYGWDEDFQQDFHQKTFNPDLIRILIVKDPIPDQSPETSDQSAKTLEQPPETSRESPDTSHESPDTSHQSLDTGSEHVFGYIELEHRETEIFLVNILIDQAFQGQGLGATVMRDLIGSGKTIRLEVFRVNTRARKFYRRLGFRTISRDKIKYIMVSSNFRKEEGYSAS